MEKKILFSKEFVEKLKDLNDGELTIQEAAKLRKLLAALQSLGIEHLSKEHKLSRVKGVPGDFYVASLSSKIRIILENSDDSIVFINLYTRNEIKTEVINYIDGYNGSSV